MIQKRSRRKDSIEQLLSKEVQPQLHGEKLSHLRYLILSEGLKVPQGYDYCPYRIYVWSVLLNIRPIEDNSRYITLLGLKEPSNFDKIRNDTFRTLTKDAKFWSKVSNDQLTRLLCAFSWDVEHNLERTGNNSHQISGYVQGMNILVAPILYAGKSETQAFEIFCGLLRKFIPLYITPTLEGVHTGCLLVDIVLHIVDKRLSDYLKSKSLKPEMYAFASVLTLCAATPPLEEVLSLWDFLFAYGYHMNILCIAARLVMMRSDLLSDASSPMQKLRQLPDLQAKEVIKLAVSFVTRIPDELYDLLVRHGYDESVRNSLINKYGLP